jgi:twinkle protein
MDVLSAIEAGLNNVVSVPAGAPVKVADGKVLPSEDKKFAFVWNAREILEKVPYVVLATDQDSAGQALAEELARRIGKDKCRLAKFDKKDLNDVLLDDDPTEDDDPSRKMQKIIDAAQPYPVSGLTDPSVFYERLNDLYTKGTGKGFSTGYPSVDEVYTVAPAQLTVVTGYPSSGKSNFIDQVMVNLARGADWKFAVCSFENQPEIHISRLMEIYTKKRFFDGKERMTPEEKERAFKWVQEHFLFIDTNGEEPSTLDSILDRAKIAVKRMGVRGLVIDPYNYIELNKTNSTETEAISNMLTRVQKFCKAFDVHTWFIAHPSKINRSGVEQPRPDGMSISGSMAWWAKTDCGITVHRADKCVEIAVWKCRYRWVGTQGETTLLYNKTAGTYSENLDAF